jgi:hypothetical protein
MSRQLADAALAELSRAFAKLYARDGRPSIPPERPLRGVLLQALGDPIGRDLSRPSNRQAVRPPRIVSRVARGGWRLSAMAPKGILRAHRVHYMFRTAVESILPTEPVMVDQIVITEKSSQAKDVRAAVGSRYGEILPAEGHLFDLLEPEDVVP